MSNVSASSTGTSTRTRVRVTGIPKLCWCGENIVEKTSRTNGNPFRRYFQCAYAATKKLENDDHVFKWVDEAMINEIEQLDFQVGVLEEEVRLLKMERNGSLERKEINKTMGMVLVLSGCIITVVIGKWWGCY
ncbi:PREDICTED: uncharacterized protein At4g04775-like [Camelina sativa]|uniref:Uncharacterized protein At4g04775-like n=1 Tax=Camelina sativa TaxID=90675 RepID=A0ABM0UT06_CAMSA|nr:PREDICTED: uncharacterized protein At4g04775-like [Camelina sativa]